VFFALLAFAFLAGFVDSIVGGGGLIQIPALFVFLPPALAANVPAVLGTNKFASICGTSVAAGQYSRRVQFKWRILGPCAGMALVLSWVGARTVSQLDPRYIKPLVLALLVLIAVYTYAKKPGAEKRQWDFSRTQESWLAVILGAVIGFYDGFFGPGTGSFLIIGFVGLFGFDFLPASGSAKVVNLTTNFAAILWFAWSGNVLYRYAVPMAAANIAGAAVGSRLAMLKGNAFIRRFFLGIVLVLIIRFAWELGWQK
jgi:uncharacterized membrane protein YfcA